MTATGAAAEVEPEPAGPEPEPAGPERVRWCRGTRLLVAATLLWLVFVLAYRLLDGRVFVWTLAELLPPPVFLLVPIVLLALAPLARPARWRIVAGAAVALLLGAGMSGFTPLALLHSEPPAPPGALKVVSWNTQFWDQTDNPDDFFRFLRAQDADVYLLQEYVFFRRADKQVLRVDDAQRLRAEFPGYQVVATSELVTLSRLPIVSWHGVDATSLLSTKDHDLPPADAVYHDYWIQKSLRTDIRVAGRVMSFYNVHIPVPLAIDHSPVGGRFWGIMREQYGRRSANFAALRADVAGNHNPVVVAGDLNTTPSMASMGDLPPGLVDASPALGSLYPRTWTLFGPRLWRMDWVFTTPDVAVHTYRFGDPQRLSDHSVQRLVISLRAG